MTSINSNGMIVNAKVVNRRFPHIEHGALQGVHAIVVHQTDAPTAQHSFNAYNRGGNGAHFLISKNGQIYQTASLHKRCYHVGRLIKSKCLTINKRNCTSPDMARILAMSWRKQFEALNIHERKKIILIVTRLIATQLALNL